MQYNDPNINSKNDPVSLAKRDASEIYQKYHPNTSKNLWGDLLTEENSKNQFSKKNMEFVTLNQYRDFVVSKAKAHEDLRKRELRGEIVNPDRNTYSNRQNNSQQMNNQNNHNNMPRQPQPQGNMDSLDVMRQSL